MLQRNKLSLILLLFALVLTFNNAYAQPKISSFSPASGPIGTVVTISGSGFSATPGNNTVYFGAIKATPTAATTGSLTVAVPAGANYDLITVTVNGFTAFSVKPFLVTFNGGGNISPVTFSDFTQFTADLHPNGLVMTDFDGDGRIDLATPNNYSITGQPASLSILRNTSSGGTISFAPHQDISNGVGTYAIASGDMDGDGKKDIIVNSILDHTISVARNTSVSGTISFAAKQDFPATGSVYGVIVNDIDGDGRPDLTVVNGLENGFSVYRNTSSGPGNISFANKIDITSGIFPRDLAVGDVDGDGKPDVLIANNANANFSVFRNTSISGGISFAPKTDYNCGTGVQVDGLTLTDMDGDGQSDLAVVVSLTPANTNQLLLFRNNSVPGSVSLSFSASFEGGANSGYHVAAGDINGDGKPDLAYGVTNNDKVKIYQNISVPGSINFTEAANAGAFSPYAMGIADLDGDSKPELISTFFTSTTVLVFKNKNGIPVINSFTPDLAGPGTTITISGYYFTGATSVKFGGTAAASFTVVNSNTITAVVGAGASGDVEVTTPLGVATKSGFNFSTVPKIISYAPSVGFTGTVVTLNGINFNGASSVQFGGVPASAFTVVSTNVITATVGAGASGDITVIFPSANDTAHGFIFSSAPVITSFSPASGLPGSSVTLTGTNFNSTPGNNIVYFGNEKATVVSGTSTSLVVTAPAVASAKPISVTSSGLTGYSRLPFVFRQNTPVNISAATFPARTDLLLTSPSYGTETGDLDNDGRTDIAATDLYNNILSVFRNAGTPGNLSFAPKLDSVASGSPYVISVEDMDGDGLKDLAVCNYGVSVYRNQSVPGTLAFGPRRVFETNGLPPNFAVADLNADGKPDMAFANILRFAFMRNTTTGGQINFAPVEEIGTGNYPQAVALADFDGDGKADAAVVNAESNTLSVLKNVTAGTNISFAPQIDYVAGNRPFGMTAGDLDGDGKPDIAVANYNGDNVSVFRNTGGNGVIAFANKVDYNSGGQPRSVIFGDINGDGKPDMIVVNATSNSFSVYQNSSVPGTISFASRTDVATGAFPQYPALGDFDGDGKLDVAIAGYASKAISVHLNASTSLTVLGFTPATGTTGTTVTISGTNFTGVTGVSFGGVAASSFTVVNSTTITAVVAAGASGNVTVTNASGSAYKAGFVYTLPTGVSGVNANNNKELLASPNPARDVIVITHPVTGKAAQLQLVDMNGQVVRVIAATRNQAQTSFSVKDLPAGIYKLIWTDQVTLLRRTVMVTR